METWPTASLFWFGTKFFIIVFNLFQDPSYTFSGVPPAPVPKNEIHKFFIKFRVQVAAKVQHDVTFGNDNLSGSCIDQKQEAMIVHAQAAGAGGPDVKSKDFLRMTNVIRKEVKKKLTKREKQNRDFNPEPQWPAQDALIESANWEIPGYAKGIYHVLVHDGKVMWEQAIVG